MLRNRDLLSLSFQGFTVEDEFGGLEFLSGDLSPMLEKPPVYDRIFAAKLLKPMIEPYEKRQVRIWLDAPDGEVFDLNSEWKVCIIPLLFEEERFTVSLFFTA
jgi:hypothetical protein